jgi:hypothetical protein
MAQVLLIAQDVSSLHSGARSRLGLLFLLLTLAALALEFWAIRGFFAGLLR